MSNNISTVNVIEYADDSLISLRAFQDTPEGNKEAEALFTKVIQEHGAEKDDLPTYVENGDFWEDVGDYQAWLLHSNM